MNERIPTHVVSVYETIKGLLIQADSSELLIAQLNELFTDVDVGLQELRGILDIIETEIKILKGIQVSKSIEMRAKTITEANTQLEDKTSKLLERLEILQGVITKRFNQEPTTAQSENSSQAADHDSGVTVSLGKRATQESAAFNDESSRWNAAAAQAIIAPELQQVVNEIDGLTDPVQIIEKAIKTKDFPTIQEIAKRLSDRSAVRTLILNQLANLRSTIGSDNSSDQRYKQALKEALQEKRPA